MWTTLSSLVLLPFGWAQSLRITNLTLFNRSSGRARALSTFRWVGILILTVYGLLALTHASPGTLTQIVQAEHTSPTAASQAGGMMEDQPPCGLGDITCYCDRLATFLTEQAWNAIKPLVDASVLSPASVVIQTPPGATYQNAQIQQMVTWELGAIDSALALLVGFLAYNLIVGRSIGMHVPTFQEALPRLLVAFVAAHLCLYVCRLLIDLNNDLAIGVYELFLKTYLHDSISSMIHYVETTDTTGAVLGYLLRAWLVMYIFVQLLWIFWQMLVRLALIALLTMLSPLGLMCLALPQTQRWGQMWLSAFVSTVIMQFLQLAALSLGSLLISYSASAMPSVLWLQQLNDILLSGAVFYLVPRLPHMLQEYALRPILMAQRSQDQMVQRAVETVTQETTQMLKRAAATA